MSRALRVRTKMNSVDEATIEEIAITTLEIVSLTSVGCLLWSYMASILLLTALI